jgi:hypothetical protein
MCVTCWALVVDKGLDGQNLSRSRVCVCRLRMESVDEGELGLRVILWWWFVIDHYMYRQ